MTLTEPLSDQAVRGAVEEVQQQEQGPREVDSPASSPVVGGSSEGTRKQEGEVGRCPASKSVSAQAGSVKEGGSEAAGS